MSTFRWPSLGRLGSLAGATVALALTSGTANAVPLVADGISYELIALSGTSTTEQFQLKITGINAVPGDTEGGRTGLDAIAFTLPTGFVNAVMIDPATGWVLKNGGLNSVGCNLTGNFFCFDNQAINQDPSQGPIVVPTTPLAANSEMDFIFNMTAGAGFLASYDPHIKVNWVGSQNNYDLVSQAINIDDDPPPVPEPGSLAILGSALVGLGLLRKRFSRSA